MADSRGGFVIPEVLAGEAETIFILVKFSCMRDVVAIALPFVSIISFSCTREFPLGILVRVDFSSEYHFLRVEKTLWDHPS